MPEDVVKVVIIEDKNDYYKTQRYEYSSGNPIYYGKHVNGQAPTSDDNWEIEKFTWSGNDMTLREGPLTGAWDNRATLDWA